MNDCLVKRLKGVVDNDSLLKLGEMVINCSTAACGGTTLETDRTFVFNPGVGNVISAEGRTFKVRQQGQESFEEVTEFTVPILAEYEFVFPDGEYNVHISNKYTILGFGGMPNQITYSNFFSFDLSDLQYSENFFYANHLDKYAIKGELKKVANTATFINLREYLSTDKNEAIINIGILNDCDELIEIRVYGGLNTDKVSYGTINGLKSKKLRSLLINRTKITGDINTMIQAMVANGREDGTFINAQGNNYITVNGVAFNTFRDSLPGTEFGVTFTIDRSAPNNWTAVRSDH